MRTKLASILAFFILSPFASAADYFGQSVSGLDDFDLKRIQVEALMHTVSNASSLSFGPSVNYKLTDTNHFVFRTVAPISGFSEPGDVETMSAQFLWRYKLNQRRASFFTELGLAYNQYRSSLFGSDRFLDAGSFGSNIGMSYQINNELSIGGIAGFEWANTRIGRQAIRTTPDVRFYPRLALLVGLQL